ncbi:MAG: serine/threonine-protein kinase [Planctomycetota bacterium]
MSIPVAEPLPPSHHDLPAALAEAAAEQIIAVEVSARETVLRSLIAAHPEHADALRGLAEDLAQTDELLAAGFPGAAPVAIGPYRVIRRLGAGAFGVVFLATQEQPIQRQVAIKILRPGAGDRNTLARFERERQLLAQLSHPAIAHVLDAGVLPDGRPFFVMEFVDGPSIRSYCDDKQLTVESCLRLFLELCRGVEHAHRRGIVHRDLKPANVLVVDNEDCALPKIIDFGIAKALHALAPNEGVHTDTGRVIGTPGYMSPEQAAGQVGDVDARADVFALGVMLYELLTGELPWGKQPDSTSEDPPRLSIRVASEPTGTTAAARRRESHSRHLASRLRGDLDCIALKALAREREHRYQSAQDLADDIDRHLRGVPVLAEPPSLGSRLRRLARRRRSAFLAAGVVAVTLLFGLWWGLYCRAKADTSAGEVEDARGRLAVAQDRAAQSLAAAEEAAYSLLTRANDKLLRDVAATAPVRKMLVQDALGFYDKFLRDRPAEPALREGRTRTLQTLSRVQWLVGQYEAAATTAREAIAEAQTLLASKPDHCTYRGLLGNAQGALGRALVYAGREGAARQPLRDAVDAYERCYAEERAKYSLGLVESLSDWSMVLTHDDEVATKLDATRRAVEIGESHLRECGLADAETPKILMRACGWLGHQLLLAGNVSDAEKMLQRADELRHQTPDPGVSQVCALHITMGMLASMREDHARSIERFEQGILAAKRWSELDPSRPPAWQALAELYSRLAIEQATIGDEQAAADANRSAIAVTETCVANFPMVSIAKGTLANLLNAFACSLLPVGKRSVLAEAETCARRGLDVLDSVPEDVDRGLRLRQRWRSLAGLGLVLDARGGTNTLEHWEATARAMDTYQAEVGVTADDSHEFVQATIRVAEHRFQAGLDDSAEQCLRRATELIRERQRVIPGLSGQLSAAGRVSAMIAARRGHLDAADDEAERVLADCPDWRGALAAADGMRAAWRAAAAARSDAAYYRDRAIDLYETAVHALEDLATSSPDDIWVVVPLGQARIELAELRIDRGEKQPALELLEQALPALAAVRDEAHANCWDEALFVRGRELAAQ